MRPGLFACLLLLCTSLPLGAAGKPEWFRILSEPIRASALLGKEVRTRQGEYIGTVRDLVFDLENNRVHHAVVGSEGRARAYPMHALEAAGRHLVLDLPDDPIEQRWSNRRLLSAQALLGARLPSGTVMDAVIDAFWGNVAFAVIGSADALRPVPLDAFREENGRLRLRIDPHTLRDIDAFTRKDLHARLQDTDFLRRNARLAHRLTPPAAGP